jgi:hypothetical protein
MYEVTEFCAKIKEKECPFRYKRAIEKWLEWNH